MRFLVYRATACNATRGIAVAILSVCLSDACIVTERNNRLSISQHHTKPGYLKSFHSNGGCWELSPSTRNIRQSDPSGLKCSADNCTLNFGHRHSTLQLHGLFALAKLLSEAR